MRNLVIFNLDGTLADITHRLHFVKDGKSAWRAFFAACDKDILIAHTAAIFHLFRRNPAYEVWVVSGRSDEVKEQTVNWLLNHHLLADKIIMRTAGDHQPDDTLKASWVLDGTIPAERVLMIFDDRSKVVKTWRKLGLPCLQVAEGEF